MWTNDTQRIAFKQGGGILTLFGLPFLGMGLWAAYAAATGQMTHSETGQPASPWFGVPLGLLFALIGAALVLGRAGTIIDREQGQVTTWWGLLVPFRRVVHRLSDFVAVRVDQKVVRTRNGDHTVYPIMLERADDEVAIRQTRNATQARQVAERVASFLNLPLRDATGDTVVERDAAQLDESVRDRARREGKQLTWPTEPPGCRVRCALSGDEVTIELPRTGFNLGLAIRVVAGFAVPVVAAVFLRSFLAGFGDEGFVRWILLGVFGVLFVLAPLATVSLRAVWIMRMRERVSVSPRELRIDRLFPLGRRSIKIPAEELEEFDVSRGVAPSHMAARFRRRSIIARSDDASCVFGSGLRDDERQWVHDAIRYVLVHGRPPRIDWPAVRETPWETGS